MQSCCCLGPVSALPWPSLLTPIVVQGLTLRSGMTSMQRYWPKLLELIQVGGWGRCVCGCGGGGGR